MNESILITGANAGLGKETARQLALKKEPKKVILFCRNQARAEEAKKDLEEKTGIKCFEIIIGDVTDANSARKAVEQINEHIDAVLLNAGGVIGKTAAKLTPSGMNQLAATNILGNVILAEELIKRDNLRKTVHSHPTGFERKGWSFLFAPATRQG
jgi:short-subunit dehydrogenase